MKKKAAAAGPAAMSSRTWKGSQSWNYEATWALGGRVLKVEVKRDTYNDQSYERVSLFDGDRWNEMYGWPIGDEVRAVPSVEADRAKVEKAMHAAEVRLVAAAQAVLERHDPKA
jgi:hypothetical protein